LRVRIALARYFLKHPIDCADVEVNVFVQAAAKAMDEGNCADVQGCLVHIGRTRAVGSQRLCNDPQEDSQHRAIELHEVAQPLGNLQHPQAHRQAGKHMVAKKCRRLHHAPRVAG